MNVLGEGGEGEEEKEECEVGDNGKIIDRITRFFRWVSYLQGLTRGWINADGLS